MRCTTAAMERSSSAATCLSCCNSLSVTKLTILFGRAILVGDFGLPRLDLLSFEWPLIILQKSPSMNCPDNGSGHSCKYWYIPFQCYTLYPTSHAYHIKKTTKGMDRQNVPRSIPFVVFLMWLPASKVYKTHCWNYPVHESRGIAA